MVVQKPLLPVWSRAVSASDGVPTQRSTRFVAELAWTAAVAPYRRMRRAARRPLARWRDGPGHRRKETAGVDIVGHRTAASAGELDTVGGKQEHRNKLNANSCDTVGFGAA